jgi:hypothetical protein
MQNAQAYGVPDVELAGQQGSKVNPADFAGHELVMLFCPAGKHAAAAELAAYNGVAEVLAYNDAYMVAICCAEAGSPASRILLSSDTERAWAALGKCLDGNERLDPDEGAVLLFGRGGCLTKVWRGVGHANEVAKALGERM